MSLGELSGPTSKGRAGGPTASVNIKGCVVSSGEDCGEDHRNRRMATAHAQRVIGGEPERGERAWREEGWRLPRQFRRGGRGGVPVRRGRVGWAGEEKLRGGSRIRWSGGGGKFLAGRQVTSTGNG